MAQTCLHDIHQRLGARIVDFHGWDLPIQYEGILAEHRHCREAAVVFNTSHMGQLLIRGDHAAEGLGCVTTQNAEALAVGRCAYGFLLNEDAGIIDDTILMRLDEREFLLVVNSATADGDAQWLRSHLPGDVELLNQSASWGKIDLQGPASCKVLAAHADFDPASLAYFTGRRGRCCGADCVVSRTGYTGELGYEIMADNDDLPAIFDALLAEASVKPAGLGARDSLRLEMGYPLYGQDIGLETNPIEADLGRFVRDDHEFIGSRRLGEIRSCGTDRRAVAFRSASRRKTSPDDEILRDGEPVGVVSSGAFSPSLEVSIGMGYVPAKLSEAGTTLSIRTARNELEVVVCPRPIYRDGTCRTRQPMTE